MINYPHNFATPAATVAVYLFLWTGCIYSPTASNDQILTSISVSTSQLVLKIGESAVIKAEVLDQTRWPIADASMNWSSSDPEVVTVNNQGVLTAVSFGRAEITVQSRQ